MKPSQKITRDPELKELWSEVEGTSKFSQIAEAMDSLHEIPAPLRLKNRLLMLEETTPESVGAGLLWSWMRPAAVLVPVCAVLMLVVLPLRHHDELLESPTPNKLQSADLDDALDDFAALDDTNSDDSADGPEVDGLALNIFDDELTTMENVL